MHSPVLTFLSLGMALKLTLGLASPAVAGSIETWSTIPIAHPPSVTDIKCPDCTAKETVKLSTYTVPTLDDGQQKLQLLPRDGKQALVRTEAFMGGSPVTYVSLNPVFVETEQKALAGDPALPSPVVSTGDGVDLEATTSAVGQGSGLTQPLPSAVPPAEPAPDASKASTPPDFSGLELRPTHSRLP
ncbi:plant virulence effector HPE1-like domain-containing protein [Rhizobium sp. SSA_523]|uniref:plant virulence effector HPE1-like domain-containing protein n=1 Tax=Rhizobium sp. SSA_523 TaxID=2952477 RepID=UPI002090D8BC|nr:plant virulence effector HPE1-like domain-containing protein [Rhizobium sp. SSA_523]MCO5731096.1 hypothetical protein [Rhizobium sp. SSA_523]WKC24104.1 plant virulence effector HPE1-like domain-containing protein [Rhizobium sp. SSA_523]